MNLPHDRDLSLNITLSQLHDHATEHGVNAKGCGGCCSDCAKKAEAKNNPAHTCESQCDDTK